LGSLPLIHTPETRSQKPHNDATSDRKSPVPSNERRIPTPRGARWHVSSVAKFLARALKVEGLVWRPSQSLVMLIAQQSLRPAVRHQVTSMLAAVG
jgi:hypothetical protein